MRPSIPVYFVRMRAEWLPIALAVALFLAFCALAAAVGWWVGQNVRKRWPRARKVLMWLSGIVTLLFLLPATICLAVGIETGRYPYNKEGRYFDGVIVYHEDDPAFFVLQGVLCAFPCVIAGALFARLRKVRETAPTKALE